MKDMKLKNLICLALLSAGIAACSQGSDAVDEASMSNAKVSINISQASMQGDVSESRSTTDMDLSNANQIFNLYMLEYSQDGTLIAVDYKDCSSGTSGVLSTTWSPSSLKAVAAGGTICLVANVYESGVTKDANYWDTNLPNFESSPTHLLTLPLTTASGSAGLYSSKMYMFGYYKGAITDGMSLNIQLGRIASCMKVVIKTTTTNTYSVSSVAIKNAVLTSRYYPSTDTNDLTYGDFTDTFTTALSVTSSNPQTLYYYTAENMNPTEAHRTSVTINSKHGTTTNNVTVDLGTDSPSVTTNRNYSLNRNNIYTFNIVLTK
jgi:hypothetical protein